jgi:hypothetical protein
MVLQSHQGMTRRTDGPLAPAKISEEHDPPPLKFHDQKTPITHTFPCSGSGFVLDVLVQSRRNKKAAKRLLRKLLKRQLRAPRVLITDKLRSYAAAKREIMPGVEHRQHKGLTGREFAPTDATTRADYETLQVATAGAAISFHP